MNDGRRHTRLVLAAAVLAMGLLSCGGRSAETHLEAFSSTATVERGTIAEAVQVAGSVMALNSRLLAFGTAGGLVLEVNVQPGQVVQKGQALLSIDTAGQERQLREAQADLRVAEAVLADAERIATTAEVARAEADLATAEAGLAAARLKLAVARHAGLEPLEEAVADAQAALQLARDQLRQQELGGNHSTIRTLEYQQAFFQRVLRDLKPGEDPAGTQAALAAVERDLASARAGRDDALQGARDQVARKEEELARAQASLARARAGEEDPTAPARLAYEQAAASLEKAREAAEDLKLGLDSASVKAAKTAYDAAAAQVADAQAAIEASTLRAPFDGVVFAVMVEAGDRVQPSDNVIYLSDPNDLRVRAQASEMEVTHLSVGQTVRLSFDAYPGRVFSGEVLSLPVRGKEAGGMSLYEVTTSLVHDDADIRPGMLANVRFVVGEKADVLTIPAAAVQYRPGGETYVAVRTPEGKAVEQAVTIGLNDGIMAEVQSGLSEGQTVLVPLVPPMGPQRFGPMGPMGPVYIEG